jgi:hypothetical protein
MDITYCLLAPLTVIGLLAIVPATIFGGPFVCKACKYIFTDRPMTLGPLFSIIAVGMLALMGYGLSNVNVKPCGPSLVAAKQAPVQTASICTCGCGRHK